MNINFNKISEIYGFSIIDSINNNINDVIENINYLEKLQFSDIEDIFERLVPIFIKSPLEFKNQINELINKIGDNYVEVIENDLSILEEIL